MNLEGTPTEVLELLSALAARVGLPAAADEPGLIGKLTASVNDAEARAAAADERTAVLRRRVEMLVERERANRHAWNTAALAGDVDYMPSIHRDPGEYPPPTHVRRWCAAHPETEQRFYGSDPGLPDQTDPLPAAATLDVDTSDAAEPAQPAAEPPAASAPTDAPAEEPTVQPLAFDAAPVPELNIRLRTPEERAAREAQPRVLTPPRPRKRLPKQIGEHGADRGDGLDVWRVDGRALYQTRRTAALAAGATPDEADALPTYTDVEYARLVAAIDAARDAGHTHPTRTVANELGRNGPGGLDHALKQARKLGIQGGGSAAVIGVQGGLPNTLTDYGRQVLANHDAEQQSDQPEPEPQPDADHADPALVELATTTTPTPEQQRQIDALNAEGQRIVDRLRRGSYSGPKAELPDRMVAVKNPSIPKPLRRAATEARYAGWAIGKSTAGHLHWYSPNGAHIVTSSTPGGHPDADLRMLRAAGLTT